MSTRIIVLRTTVHMVFTRLPSNGSDSSKGSLEVSPVSREAHGARGAHGH